MTTESGYSLMPALAFAQRGDVGDMMAAMLSIEREVLIEAYQAEVGMTEGALPI